MSAFSGLIVICVSNLEATVAWYKEKLDLRESMHLIEDGQPEGILLSSRKDEIRVVVTAAGPGEPDRPILDTHNAAKAREWLMERGVEVGPVQIDRQGTHYIEMRDLEGNSIEICEEPG
ncbi:MAG TPA: VOC family protein [Candidatus Angelobacter sp.]|nr:VOC family protein [Candidatus Angelobacter sp.]